jgi:hypothetical protein
MQDKFDTGLVELLQEPLAPLLLRCLIFILIKEYRCVS